MKKSTHLNAAAFPPAMLPTGNRFRLDDAPEYAICLNSGCDSLAALCVAGLALCNH